MITQSRLKELLHYDPDTGVFTWLVSRQRIRCGDVAGCIRSDGYRKIGVVGKPYQAHRLAWLYMTGSWPKDGTDHRNGVKDDNRWDNLREATQCENNQNMAIPSTNTSGFMGVSWDAQAGKWKAAIGIAGRVKNIGRFTTPEAAHAAYLSAKAETHTFQPTPR